MAGIPLEEPEEVLIKRGKGKWPGKLKGHTSVEMFEFH
jgi:hypothetical protein